MTKSEIKRGVAVLRKMRKLVKSGANVWQAWIRTRRDDVYYCPARRLLLRHVRRDVAPFNKVDGAMLSHARSDMPISHALKWIDTAIAYAEKHER